MFSFSIKTIKTKLILIVISVLGAGMIVAFLVNFYVSYRHSVAFHGKETHALADYAIRQAQHSIYHRLEQVQNYGDDIEKESAIEVSNNRFAQMENREEYIEEIDKKWSEDPENFESAKEITANNLSEEIRTEFDGDEFYKERYGYEVFLDSFITNRYGVNVAQSEATSDYYQADEAWWQKTKNEGIYIGDVFYDEFLDKRAMDLAVRLENDNGEFIGVFIAALNLKETQESIEQIIKTAQVGDKAQSYWHIHLVDQRDRLIFCSKDSDPGNFKTTEEAELFLPESGRLNGKNYILVDYKNSEGEKKEGIFAYAESAGYKDLPPLGWRLWVEEGTSQIYSPFYEIFYILIGIIFVVGGFLVLSGIWFVNRLMGPIDRLIEIIEEIREQGFSGKVKVSKKRKDEPAQLARAFNSMASELQKERKELKQRNEQLESTIKKIQQKEEHIEYMKRVRYLLEELTSSTDLNFIMNKLVLALKDLLPFCSVSYVLSSQGDGSNLLYINAKEKVTRNYLNKVQDQMRRFLEDNANSFSNSEEILQELNHNLFYEFVSGKLDDEGKTDFKNSLVLPFKRSGGKISGLLHFAFPEYKKYSEDQKLLAENIIEVAAVNLERVERLIEGGRERMDSLIYSLTNGVIMVDKNRTVVVANPAAAQMIGMKKEDINWKALKNCCDASQVLDSTEETKAVCRVNGEECYNLEDMINVALKNDETLHLSEVNIKDRFFEVFITPVRAPEVEVEGAAIIFNDITHLKEVDKMKTEFVSIASHQLRTPLTSIKLFAEMLVDKAKGMTKKQKEYAKNIEESTKRMVKLVNDLLNVSRLESGRLQINPEPVNLKDLIYDLAEGILPCEGKNKEDCHIALPENGVGEIPLDETLMRQVVRNLLTNAVRYSGPGECHIEINLEEQEDDYLFSVADDGIGIPKSDQDKVFGKFTRGSNAQKTQSDGSGLGMYLAKMIMEESGGEIWFESEGEGKGSTFYVKIPKEGMKQKSGEKGLAGGGEKNN